jgi:hypothetical protein
MSRFFQRHASNDRDLALLCKGDEKIMEQWKAKKREEFGFYSYIFKAQDRSKGLPK